MVPTDPGNVNQRCSFAVPAGDQTKTLVVRLTPTGGTERQIHFSLSPGASGTVTESAFTTDGVAVFTWSGQAGSRETVIRAQAWVGDRVVTREIEIVAAPPATTSRTLRLTDDARAPHWFVERQLRDSIVVVVDNPTGDCSSNIVVFRPVPSDGTTSPDSVRPTLANGRCIASTWWTLGKPVGRQHLRAYLASEPAKTVSVTAVGRSVPRIGAGVAFVRDWREYQTLDDSADLVVDSDRDWQVTPVAIADFPIAPRAHWMRGVLGVSLKDPSRDWYVGLSALQALFGVTRESVGVDLQVVMHAGRRDVLRDRKCDDDMDISDCANRSKLLLPLGIGFTGFVDTSAFIASIQGIFK